MARVWVVFDIGGVLELTPATGWDRAWERRLGLPDGAVADRLAPVWRAGELGRITEAEVYRRVTAEFGLDAAALAAFRHDLWTEYLGSPNGELLDYLRALRPRCGLGILSNSFVGAREREEAAYGFGALVDAVVYSHEIGVAKPDPAAYRITCERLAARPEHCLLVDDLPVNVEAARAAGWQAVLHRDNAGTVAAVEARLGARSG